MNRNEVIWTIAKVLNTHDYESDVCVDWDELPLDRKKCFLEKAEAALTALEAIMERDNVKMLDGYMPTAPTSRSAMMQEQQFKECFDQAKCKLRGE